MEGLYDGSSGAGLDITTEGLDDLSIQAPTDGKGGQNGSGVEITTFSELVEDVTLHFQIIRLQKQLYAWIGCNSARFGHLVAAAPTRPSNAVSVAQLVGRSTDNTGAGIARRVVLKTGLNIILACNIPKNSPLIEAAAERKLMQKLFDLGYASRKSGVPSSSMKLM